MASNFYDRVAQKFGGYGYGNGRKPIYKSEYPTADPEQVFLIHLMGVSSKAKIALDIGCADGKFTLSVAPHFKHIVGIDTSCVNLDIANSHSKNLHNLNVEYLLEDASKISFPDSSIDVAYCRRGPSFYQEYHRILNTTGYYLEIGIGEKDARALKHTFGRGQGFGKWDTSALDRKIQELQALGFAIIFAENYDYVEYYPSFAELDFFLQGVPIFEDYDSIQDASLLQEYASHFTSDKGIQLARHRLVLVAQKLD